MSKQKITIATRKSPLALWQANHVKNLLNAMAPELEIELLEMVTKGDKIIDRPLANIGGKGLFLKELETALLDGRADIAVHSMKDVPMNLPNGLILAAIVERGSVEDAFVSTQYMKLEQMPAGSIIGTSSARRKAVLQHYYPELIIKDIRGNLQTRLSKLDKGEYDGLILAAAGLERLGLQNKICERLAVNPWLPAPGQGAVGIECLESNTPLLNLIKQVNHPDTSNCVLAERAVSRTLEGSCAVPLAAYAKLVSPEQIELNAWVASPEGYGEQNILLQESGVVDRYQAEELGVELANKIKVRGFEAWQSKY